MVQWYVNELGKLTGVSVRTLHHYDKIGLLQPSVRMHNGYRLYSEKDLLKLQQILALKFFGFELSNIKLILEDELTLFDHFQVQSKLLEEKANSLMKANQTLKDIMLSYRTHKSIPWESVLKLIEVYRMAQQLEQSWAANIFSAEELKKFPALFTSDDLKRFSVLKADWSESDQIHYKKRWGELMNSVLQSLKEDPYGEIGKRIGKNWMQLVNEMYGNEYALRNTIWDAYRNGKVIGADVFPSEAMTWIESAITAYYYEQGVQLIAEISKHMHESPKSIEAKKLAQCWLAYSQERMCRSDKIAEVEQSLTPEIKIWIEKALL